MEEINIKLDVFEGPLDLLLHLIQKLEIDVYDIPIAAITEQYMQYIHAMKSLELEVAGEYLVMAATLMAIKSQMLLPKQEILIEENDPYEEDPRDMLVAQLLEYRKYKYAAEQLSEKAEERSLYFTKDPMDVDAYKEKVMNWQPTGSTRSIYSWLFIKCLKRKRVGKYWRQRSHQMKVPLMKNGDDPIGNAATKCQKGRRFDSFSPITAKQKSLPLSWHY